MNKEKSSYKSIMKATSLFGGVQVIKILVEIIRSKLIAVLLGPSGMGIAGLFTSTTSMISALTDFGIGISAVKSIATANETQDSSRISLVISVYKKLVWATGFLGAIVAFIFATPLSEFTFGTNDYTYGFRWLSVFLLLSRLTSGDIILLQGMRKLNYLAKANVLGVLVGLLISIPLYFYYKIDGIVPAMIVTAILSFIVTRYFSDKIKVKSTKVSIADIIREGKELLQLGIVLSITYLFGMGITYMLRVFIANYGGVDQVGLYTAGITIVSSYSGLVFSAMSTDYLPRLSGVANNNVRVKQTINEQAEIGILILAPFLTVFLIFINYAIVILYSSSFKLMAGMVHWATLGLYFKVASWSVGFILLAKGASKLFLWSEVIAGTYMFLISILGYYLFGLDGVGVAFLLSNILNTLQVYFIANKFYKFKFNKQFYIIFIIQFTIGLICFLCVKLLSIFWVYLIGFPLIILSFYYSYKELDKLINFKEIISKFRNKIT